MKRTPPPPTAALLLQERPLLLHSEAAPVNSGLVSTRQNRGVQGSGNNIRNYRDYQSRQVPTESRLPVRAVTARPVFAGNPVTGMTQRKVGQSAVPPNPDPGQPVLT